MQEIAAILIFAILVVMLTYYQSNNSQLAQTTQPDHDQPCLIYGERLSAPEAKKLAADFELPHHLLTDVFDANELPRVEVVDDINYVFARSPEMNGDKIVSRPMLFIASKTLFACISAHNNLPDALTKPVSYATKIAPGELLITSLMEIIKHYEALIDVIGSRIEKTEKLMRSHEATNKDFFSFVTIEGSLNRSRMSLDGLLVVAEKLFDLSSNKTDKEHIDDIRLFIKQLLVEIGSHAQAINSIDRAYGTVANNTLNQRMRILTVLTLLVALPNVFFGMYGMNIALPFMHEEWAYFAVMGLSGFFVFGVYFVAKKVKLL